MSDNAAGPVQIPPKGMLLNDAWYDRLKWLAQIFLPAFGAFYFGLSDLWGLPMALEVVGTITLVDTFLGVLLGLSARQYQNSPDRVSGQINIDTLDPDKEVYSIELDDHPNSLMSKSEVVFRVKNTPGEFNPETMSD